MSNALIDPDFDLVLLGTDIGMYALARAFHERYGMSSTLIAKVVAGPVKNSSFIDTIEIGEQAERADTLAEIQRQGEKRKAAGRKTLLMYNSDGFARMVTDNEEFLSQWFVVTAINNDVLDIVADKIEFGRVCDELDIPTPRTLIQDFANADSPDWEIKDVDLTFPVVAKPAVGGEFEGLRFEGKKKIYEVETPKSSCRSSTRSATVATATVLSSKSSSPVTTPPCARSLHTWISVAKSPCSPPHRSCCRSTRHWRSATLPR
ncbi:hypothetical protein [Ornithinimicrobium sp. INDO-MA30-4]|uniref:hypothetical protein n=1 Tax=Ornithinimicrobium sp. INDO-MA30-4 TaxID=2908651 RepID=UPI001F3FCAD3|nr:hypothetical protein [Ornithinimicrobium sp. INDO-MA30-4]UJH69735.1 hypothetical protein L0A91_10510 [Ornithinimicrobium sp. INDO-MA30-4]